MDLRRIRELTDAFEASDWDEINLEIDGVRIQLSATPAVDESSARGTGLDERSVRAAGTGQGSGAAGGGVGPRTCLPRCRRGRTGTPVAAPSPGIFWRAPSPGEPPFVEVGDRVEADTVVCIVELMKLMNRVVAGVSGTVTAVLADNGQPVEKGGSLVLVEQS